MVKFDHRAGNFDMEVPSQNGEATDTDVRTLERDSEGTIWMGTSNGLTLISPDGKNVKLESKPGNPKSLANDYIKSLFVDKKGSVWIGSYYGGVNIWDATNTNFINYRASASDKGLGHDVVSSITKDGLGNLYFGTEGNGVTRFAAAQDQMEYINRENYPRLLSDNIKSLFVDDNKLWMGSFDEGAFVYDLRDKQFDTATIDSNLARYLAKTGVYDIDREKSGSLWLGTFGKGLVRYDADSRQIQVFSLQTDPKTSLTSDKVRNLTFSNNGSLWVGTQNGLNYISAESLSSETPEVDHYFFDNDKKTGDDILTVFEDGVGMIWVGIRAKGLYKYTKSGFEAVDLRTEQKITSVYAITEDAEKFLWISSNQGIIKYDPISGISIRYDQEDGLSGNQFNNGSVLNVDGTRMYFGGPSGVSHFDSESLLTNTYVPKTILTDFKIGNVSLKPSEEGILKKSISYTDRLMLKYDQANFTIDFAIPNMINPASNRYRYRMAGLEDDWNLTSRTSMAYTIQNPGKYVFEVMGANNDGFWNPRPTTLEIEVAPAPWRSWWAFVGYSLLIAAALFGLIWMIQSRWRLKHQLDLEHLESERNKEIHQAKLQFFTNISHEFRTPLTLISGPLQQLLKDYKGSSFMYKKLLAMESSTKHLLRLINRLMDFRKYESRQFKLEAAEGNIVKFLREIFLSFTELAEQSGYTYTFETEEEQLLVYYDRNKLEQVFYNLISNAFKYTPKGGNVKVNIKKQGQQLVIDVSDSGEGIPERFREKVFQRFFEVDASNGKAADRQPGTGIGLAISKEVVDLHHGSIHVRSKSGPGSTFRVSLPLGRDHLTSDDIVDGFRFSDDISFYSSQLDASAEKRPDTILPNLTDDKEKDTILVVEDNKALRQFLVELLREKYQVIEAGNGQDAFKKAVARTPDLIVSDVIMPVMVGTELCARVKADLRTSHIPVILLTSRSSLVYKFEGLEKGADDYISKPFDLNEFQLRIKNLIEATKRLKRKFSDEAYLSSQELPVAPMDQQLLKRAIEIVNENIGNEKFDIPTFSEQLGISRTLLFTKIKAWTNFTPNEFIHEIRMKRAVALLEQSDLNISEIAYRVGYTSPKYFSRCFQKRFGESPSRYQSKFHSDLADLN